MYLVKPSFLIIGAQKAGTSGLFYSLAQHPDLLPSRRKEIYFFCDDEVYAQGNMEVYNRNFYLGKRPGRTVLTYEATPEYSYHPLCARRISEYSADMKIIYLVRDPVRRAYAAWQMYSNFREDAVYSELYDSRSFAQAIADELELIDEATFYSESYGYIKCGHYAEELRRYLDMFPRRNILVIEQGQLLHDWDATVCRIEEFLGVAPLGLECQKINRTHYAQPADETVFAELRRFFVPWNEDFFQLVDSRFDWPGMV